MSTVNLSNVINFYKKLFAKAPFLNKHTKSISKLTTYSNGIIVTDEKNRNLAIFSYDPNSGYYICTQSVVKEYIQQHSYAALTINRFIESGLTLNY